jgi:hypothetical protein
VQKGKDNDRDNEKHGHRLERAAQQEDGHNEVSLPAAP